jgi:hypothetical protein
MGLHCSLGHLKHKLWPKERPGVKVVVLFMATKSRESTQFPYVQATCNILLKRSRQKVQLCFKLHGNPRSAREVMHPQSRGNPSCENFGTPTWESGDKKPFGCDPHGEV